jgi:hypothetical protein
VLVVQIIIWRVGMVRTVVMVIFVVGFMTGIFSEERYVEERYAKERYTIELPKVREVIKSERISTHCICYPSFIGKGECYVYYDLSPSLIAIPVTRDGDFLKCIGSR